jgi:uncharacterized integral membrane protein
MKHEHTDGDTTAEPGVSGPPWKLIALLVVVAGLAAFIFQNGQDAPVEFLWFDGGWPVWTVIGISTIIGVVLDRLATWQWRRSRRVR